MFSEEIRRVEAYILNVEAALSNIDINELDEKARGVVELARTYLDDAKYYFERKEYFTALACIAYAEGLIDSLKHMGLIDVEWKPLSKLMNRPKVLVAGAFEIIHPGHIYLLKRAWELGRVYVVVARDSNFRRFKNREPVIPEEQRRFVVENIKYVYRAVLGDEEDIYKPVVSIKPDIILLGPDQGIEEDQLKKELCRRGLCNIEVKKLESRVGNDLCSVSSIIRKVLEIHSKSRDH